LSGQPLSGELQTIYHRLEALLAEESAPTANQARVADLLLSLRDTIESLRIEERSRRLLSEASALLAASLDLDVTLASVARLAIPHFADCCIVDLIEDNNHAVVEIAHVLPAKEELVRTMRRAYPLELRTTYGAARVLRTGQPEWVTRITDEMLARNAFDDEHLRMMRLMHPTSYMVVPLIVRERTIGAISFMVEDGTREYGERELDLAMELARRAAMAVDNARLYREAREAARRQAESLALLDTLFATAPIGLAFWDTDLRYMRVNATLASINGLSPAEHLGRSVTEILPELEGDMVGILREVLGTGQPIINLEVKGQTPAAPGVTRQWLASFYPVWTPDGTPLGVGAVVSEETERKQAEENLRQSRDQFAIILRGVGEGITVQDPSGKLVYANDIAARMIGFDTAEDLVGMSMGAIVQRVQLFDEAGVLLGLKGLPGSRALRGEIAGETLLRFRINATGEERWSIVNATPVLDEHQQVLLAVSIFHDVTERMRYEEALQFQAEASLLLSESLDYRVTLSTLARLAVPRMADLCTVTMIDGDGIPQQLAVEHTDPAKQELLAALRDEYPFEPDAPFGTAYVLRTGRSQLAKEIDDLALQSIARDEKQLAALRALGLCSAMVVPLITRGQILGTITFASAESGRRFDEPDLQQAEDLARRAALAIDQARLYAEAREAVRLRDEFLSVAAHELKTPVTALMGYAQVLHRRMTREQRLSERDQRALMVVVEQSGRLSRLIGSLLDISRMQTGIFEIELQPFVLGPLIYRVAEETLPTLQNHVLRLEVDEAPLIINGDAMRVEQMLRNLVQNAIKYSPDGGTITLRATAQDGQIVISVSDEGIGIPASALPRLFQRFFRAGNAEATSISGMGIGLFVVKEIATRHGGSVGVRSVEGEGSTFTVSLPRAGDDEHPTILT
jgi:PAS domain S-box-containing protein